MVAWRTHAAQLADRLQANGDLTTAAWRAAVAGTPRHVLVPTTYPPPADRGPLTDTRLSTAEHLDLAYSATTLVTAVARNEHGSLVAVSSSTKPDLMVRMLESLEIREAHRILEIGTGTGYHAALLAHRLGDDNVFSVDIDPDLVDAARRRLSRIGRNPGLAVRDGATGWPEHAPYDRILCTCAVRAIPWSWYDQLVPGGMLVVDFRPQGGNLVRLTKKAARLEGRFIARHAAFMAIRRPDDRGDLPEPAWLPEFPLTRERRTCTPAEFPAVVGFLRSVAARTPLRRTVAVDGPTRHPRAVRFAAADGSCCEVDLRPADDGTRVVREGGPTPLWAEVERADHRWRGWGEPGWDRIGVTIGPDSGTVWLDEPHQVVGLLPAAG